MIGHAIAAGMLHHAAKAHVATKAVAAHHAAHSAAAGHAAAGKAAAYHGAAAKGAAAHGASYGAHGAAAGKTLTMTKAASASKGYTAARIVSSSTQ